MSFLLPFFWKDLSLPFTSLRKNFQLSNNSLPDSFLMNYFHFLFTTILQITPEILPASLQKLAQVPLGTFENITAEVEGKNFLANF